MRNINEEQRQMRNELEAMRQADNAGREPGQRPIRPYPGGNVPHPAGQRRQ